MGNKIKIAFVFGELGGGGAQRQFGWLIKNMNRDKFDVTAVSITNKNYNKEQNRVNNETSLFLNDFLYKEINDVCKIEFINRKSFIRTGFALYKYFKTENYNIIFYVTPLAALLSLIPSFFLLKPKVIHGVRGNGILLSFEKSIYNVIHWISQLRVNWFVMNSEKLLSNALNCGYKNKKLHSIYNGIPTFYDVNHFDSEKTSPINIGFIARFHPVKNHKMFIEAIGQCLGMTEKSFNVHLYGSGQLKEQLMNQVSEMKLNDVICFEGWITNSKQALIENDIICLTSNFEGFNNSIGEAQMHGIPVVTTDCTGSSEIVEHGLTGYVVKIGDKNAFANALVQLIENDALRNKFASEAYKRARKLFPISKMVGKYEEFFHEICKKKSK